MASRPMRWKNVKFWCWLEIDFPGIIVERNNGEFWIEDDSDGYIRYGDGPQGAQGAQGCGPEQGGFKHCFELLSFSSEFELNAIPTAVVSVAIGRRADDVENASEIHYQVDSLQIQLPARVYCQAMTNSASDYANYISEWWPDGKFKIFDGYITGSAFRRSSSGAELTLSLTHWLTDLNFSSALSRTSHPLNPSQYFFDSNFSFGTDAQGGSIPGDGGPVMVGAALALPFFSTETILDDFWGGQESVPDGLKRWLLFLTRQDRINTAQISDLSEAMINFEPQLNWEACRALSRFEPNARTPEVTETGYVLGVPLGMSDHGSLNGHIADSIATEIGMESLETYSNVTLWDKLAGQFHANYMYSVVPLVDKALVVPFVPGLADPELPDRYVHRIIYASQYEVIDMQSTIPRPLRAVGVIMNRNNEAGGSMTHDEAAPYASFGGYFDKMAVSPDQRYKEGLIMFKEGPRWLSNFVAPWKYSASTTNSSALSGIVSTTLNPGEGDAHQDDTPRTILSNARPVWDLYARTLYIHEVLKLRQLTISGPVRFDIAPGSQVKLETTEDKFVKEVVYPGSLEEPCDPAFQTHYWASVLRVSTVIDCQNMRANTNFYMAHFRDAEENSDPATSIPYHPLWSKCVWAGCALVQNDAFSPVSTKECNS